MLDEMFLTLFSTYLPLINLCNVNHVYLNKILRHSIKFICSFKSVFNNIFNFYKIHPKLPLCKSSLFFQFFSVKNNQQNYDITKSFYFSWIWQQPFLFLFFQFSIFKFFFQFFSIVTFSQGRTCSVLFLKKNILLQFLNLLKSR